MLVPCLIAFILGVLLYRAALFPWLYGRFTLSFFPGSLPNTEKYAISLCVSFVVFLKINFQIVSPGTLYPAFFSYRGRVSPPRCKPWGRAL